MTSVQPGTVRETNPENRPPWCPPEVWPYEIRTVTLDGATIAYTDHGPRLSEQAKADSPTLVFVHAGMWSFIFREVIERLSEEFRCLTLDFPGHGLSPEPPERYATLDDHRRLFARFCETLELDNIVPVLHDLGGPVAIGGLDRHHDRVRGLVLTNTFLWRPDATALRLMLRVISSRTMTGFDRMTGMIPRASAGGGGIGRHLDKASKQSFVAGMRQPRRTARFHRLMRDALRADDLYRNVEAATAGPLRDIPVLTIFGEKNDPFGFQDRHHATFPNHEGHVVDGGNHFPMMDDPDLYADLMRTWIKAEL